MNRRALSVSYFIPALYTLLVAGAPDSAAPHLLALFFKPATISDNQHLDAASDGIYVLYHGMIKATDFNGQATFPLKGSLGTLTVIVTEAIKPIIVFGNTTHHLETVEGVPSRWYEYRHSTGPEGVTWLMSLMAPPANNRIPDDALVIIAQPDGIIIDEHHTQILHQPTTSLNLVVPTFLVADTMNRSLIALQFLKVAKFFAPVRESWSYTPISDATIITY